MQYKTRFAAQGDLQTIPRASQYFRLHPIETSIHYNKGHYIVLAPVATSGVVEVVCSGIDEIIHLIDRGILVPDIVGNKEYIVQRAVGSVDYRTYRLRNEIAAKYQFSYAISMILSTIENLMGLCDYNIFDNDAGPNAGGQKVLEIIPREGTKVYDYLNNPIINSTNEMYNISQFSFEDMCSRGILTWIDHKWKLSKKYWEFNL